MKRVKRAIIAAICILAVVIVVVLACMSGSEDYLDDLSYVEWRDDSGIFKFRSAIDSLGGYGTVVLKGKTIPASFSIRKKPPFFSIHISVESAQKIDYIIPPYIDYDDIVYDSFQPIFSKRNKTIASRDGVELFGVKIGKVVLKAYPLDKSEFAIWEILSKWSDSDNRFKLYNYNDTYFLYKCLLAETVLPDGKTKYLTFRWLTEKQGFRIYDRIEENEYKNITDETPYLAEGTYEYDDNFETITLHFVKDEIMGLQGQSLELTEF